MEEEDLPLDLLKGKGDPTVAPKKTEGKPLVSEVKPDRRKVVSLKEGSPRVVFGVPNKFAEKAEEIERKISEKTEKFIDLKINMILLGIAFFFGFFQKIKWVSWLIYRFKFEPAYEWATLADSVLNGFLLFLVMKRISNFLLKNFFPSLLKN